MMMVIGFLNDDDDDDDLLCSTLYKFHMITLFYVPQMTTVYFIMYWTHISNS